MSSTRSFQFIDPDNVRGPLLDDITKKMQKGTLQDAYDNFKSNCAKYQPYSILMFPQIEDFKNMEFQGIDFNNYFNKLKQNNALYFDVESLMKVTNDVYIIEQVATTDEYNDAKLQDFVTNIPSVNIPEEDEWNHCVEMMKDLFKNSGATYAYMRDILIPPDETGNMLEQFPSHISAAENPELKIMPGINSSMHYVGEKGSFTPLHVEDGGLSSINLLKDGGPKMWYIVPYQFQAEVEACLADYIKMSEKRKAKKGKKDVDICKDLLQHKTYLITPKLLSEWNIPYSIVIQRPGDLFFIRTGTYHAVLNIEKNIAEAINFGCDQWTSTYQPVPCSCVGNLKTEVQQDRRIIISYNKCKKKLYKCDFACGELFVTKAKLKRHEKVIHKISFQCAECSLEFNEKKNLIRHIRTHSVEKIKKECKICKKKVGDLKQHIKRIHENLKTCEKCKKKFYSNRIEQHIQKCMIECPVCHIICTNKGYLTQHMKHKHTSK